MRSTKRITAASLPRLFKTPGYHCDGGGLYLQVTSSGARSWIFRFMLNRRAREMGLGSAVLVDLPSARARVHELRQLLTQGVDPIEHRDQLRLAALQPPTKQPTFEECAADYLKKRAGKWTNEKHKSQWESTLKTYAYPAFGRQEVGTVTEGEIIKAIKPIWLSKHETATRVLSRIRLVLTWAAASKRRPPLPNGLWEAVAAAMPDWKGKPKHHAACPYDDAGKLLVKVRDSSASSTVKLAFVFTVLTAARSGETRGAVWSEVDLKKAVWTIPAERMKAGAEHRVPLCSAAISILEAAKEQAGGKASGLIFKAPKGGQFSDMVFTQLLRRLDQPYTMHGFRSTFRDWSADKTHYPREVCEAALAHTVENKVEAAYRRSDLFAKRQELMDDWATFLETSAVWSSP